MTSLISQVKSKLFIRSSQKSMHALDGAYASLLRGRSLDFEDLRPYECGDQVRDIDWRATAKQGEPLIKRTKATRKHTVLFLVDSGRGMKALAEDEQPKRDLTILLAGILGFLTVRHGDDFAFIHGDASRVTRMRTGSSEGSLEHSLRTLQHAIDNGTAPNDRDAVLRYTARNISRRRIVVILTDEAPMTDETDHLMRRLKVQHDVLWLTVRDAELVIDAHSTAATRRRDVDTQWTIPDFVHGDAQLMADLQAQEATATAHRDDVLRRHEITHAEFGAQSEAVATLLAMLNRRSHARI